MTDPRSAIVDWVRGEMAAEADAGFARLARVPDTRVVRFLDHYAALSPEGRADFLAGLADWSSYHFTGGPIPDATYRRFAAATAYPDRAEGVRYTGVLLLAGLAKSPGGLTGWLDGRGIVGPARLPAETLATGIDDLVPVKTATLRRLVRDEFAARFAPAVREFPGDDIWWYDGTLAGATVRVEVRYSGKMGRPQLHYRVEARTATRVVAPPNLCFESVLGAGFGTWDYLTRENVGRSVVLLGELVEYAARLPERLPG